MRPPRRGALFVLLAALALAPATASAQGAAAPPSAEPLEAMFTLNGTCSQLIVSGDDLSGHCDNVVLNTVHKDGRTGFLFVARDLAVATFSGDDHPAVAGKATVQLDRVVISTLIHGKASPVTLPATGTCVYANSDGKQITINCRAATRRGAFEAAFVSNGQPPRMSSP